MSWTEDGNIITTWYEDNIHSGENTYFNTILKKFDMIEYKFNEIDFVVTKAEDPNTTPIWAEDPNTTPIWSEDPNTTPVWSED